MSPIVFVVLGLLSLEVTCYSLHTEQQRHVMKRFPADDCPAAISVLEGMVATVNSDLVDLLCEYSSKAKTCFDADPDLIKPLSKTVRIWFLSDMPFLCRRWKEDAKKVADCISNNMDKIIEVCETEPMPDSKTVDSMIDMSTACYSKPLVGCYNKTNLRDIVRILQTFWHFRV